MSHKRAVEGNELIISDDSGRTLFSMREEDTGGVMRLILSGTITPDAAHEFEDELVSASTVCKNLELDFSDVSSICSTGLKALLSTQQFLDKEPHSSFVLQHLCGDVARTFRETGFIDLFDIREQ